MKSENVSHKENIPILYPFQALILHAWIKASNFQLLPYLVSNPSQPKTQLGFFFLNFYWNIVDFPVGLDSKESARDAEDWGFILGL